MEKSGKEVSTTSRNKEVVYRFELPDGTSLSATSQKTRRWCGSHETLLQAATKSRHPDSPLSPLKRQSSSVLTHPPSPRSTYGSPEPILACSEPRLIFGFPLSNLDR